MVVVNNLVDILVVGGKAVGGMVVLIKVVWWRPGSANQARYQRSLSLLTTPSNTVPRASGDWTESDCNCAWAPPPQPQITHIPHAQTNGTEVGALARLRSGT